MTSRAVLSAGSNLGDRLEYLNIVLGALDDDLLAVSSVYVTPPWGGVEQGDFFNITLIAESDRDFEQWLDFAFACEMTAERERDVRWGPRTLDVDVISVDVDGQTVVSDDPDLTLPHPRASQRAFVLVPWLEIDPDATLWTPDGVRPVRDLVQALDPTEVEGVRRLDLSR